MYWVANHCHSIDSTGYEPFLNLGYTVTDSTNRLAHFPDNALSEFNFLNISTLSLQISMMLPQPASDSGPTTRNTEKPLKGSEKTPKAADIVSTTGGENEWSPSTRADFDVFVKQCQTRSFLMRSLTKLRGSRLIWKSQVLAKPAQKCMCLSSSIHLDPTSPVPTKLVVMRDTRSITVSKKVVVWLERQLLKWGRNSGRIQRRVHEARYRGQLKLILPRSRLTILPLLLLTLHLFPQSLMLACVLPSMTPADISEYEVSLLVDGTPLYASVDWQSNVKGDVTFESSLSLPLRNGHQSGMILCSSLTLVHPFISATIAATSYPCAYLLSLVMYVVSVAVLCLLLVLAPWRLKPEKGPSCC